MSIRRLLVIPIIGFLGLITFQYSTTPHHLSLFIVAGLVFLGTTDYWRGCLALIFFIPFFANVNFLSTSYFCPGLWATDVYTLVLCSSIVCGFLLRFREPLDPAVLRRSAILVGAFFLFFVAFRVPWPEFPKQAVQTMLCSYRLTKSLYSEAYLVSSFINLVLASLIYLVFAHAVSSEARMEQLERWVIAGASAASIFGLMAFLLAENSQKYALGSRLEGGFINPNFFAGYLLLFLPFLVMRFSRSKHVARYLIVLPLAAFFLTKSKGGIIAFGLTLVLMTFPRWRGWLLRHRRAVALSMVLGISAAAFLLYSSSMHQLNPLFGHRLYVWQAALILFSEHPLLGIGWGGTFQRYLAEYGSRFPNTGGPNYPHSLYLQLAAETGIVGLSAYGYFLAGSARQALRNIVSLPAGRQRDLLEGLTLGVAALLIHSVVEEPTLLFANLVMFFSWMGIVSCRIPRAKGTIQEEEEFYTVRKKKRRKIH